MARTPLLLNGEPWVRTRPASSPPVAPAPRDVYIAGPPGALAACGCCSVYRSSFACCSSALVQAVQMEISRDKASGARRTFDHLDGSDPEEDLHFSRVARAMRANKVWWFAYVPVPRKPLPKNSNNLPPVSGEIEVQ